jgi:hypothetical protein
VVDWISEVDTNLHPCCCFKIQIMNTFGWFFRIGGIALMTSLMSTSKDFVLDFAAAIAFCLIFLLLANTFVYRHEALGLHCERCCDSLLLCGRVHVPTKSATTIAIGGPPNTRRCAVFPLLVQQSSRSVVECAVSERHFDSWWRNDD